MTQQEALSRLPSREEEAIEEALAHIFKALEKGDAVAGDIRQDLRDEVPEGSVDQVIRLGFVVEEGGKFRLSPKGEAVAVKVIRRSRLSERLLADVLGVHDEKLMVAACQFEHVLSQEIADSICTLLGHPTECPHQNPIPPGECCKKAETVAPAVVVPLSKMEANGRARLAYLQFKKNPEIYRLLSLGLVPGSELKLIQRYPTFVVQVGEAQLALDESMAAHIFVRPVY